MNNILKRPAIFHGIMTGLVLLAIKLVLAFSGNWSFRLQPTYNMIAFLAIVLAMVFSGIAEKRRQKSVSYGRALLNCLITIMITVFLSLLGDQIAYRSNSQLAENAKNFQAESANENLNKVNFFSDAYKEQILSGVEDMKPEDLYSITNLISSWVAFTFFNGLWALIVAAFMRKARDPMADDLSE